MGMRKHARRDDEDWVSQDLSREEIGSPDRGPRQSREEEENARRQRESLEVSAVAGERSRLLARKHGGQKLSPNEKERLELLTARLKDLLPPVSVDDLEILLAMTEEMEHIRERARERRRRLGSNQTS
jgi:hypothetical protein